MITKKDIVQLLMKSEKPLSLHQISQILHAKELDVASLIEEACENMEIKTVVIPLTQKPNSPSIYYTY